MNYDVFYCEPCRSTHEWPRSSRSIKTICQSCRSVRRCYALSSTPSADLGLPKTIKVSEIASLLQVSPQTVRNWIASGRLSALRTPGGHLRIPWIEVSKLLS